MFSFSRQALEGILAKSRSQAGFGNEHKATVRRSNTTAVRKVTKEGEMPQSIAELQATLQRKGESEWRKRYVQSNAVDDELKLLKEKNKYNVSWKNLLIFYIEFNRNTVELQ